MIGNYHEKRLTPRQLLIDIIDVLHSHQSRIESIRNVANTNIEEVSSVFDVEFQKIKFTILSVLNTYRDHSYWQAFLNENIRLDENTTYNETMAYLDQMMLSSNDVWRQHIIDGHVSQVYHHLYQKGLHRDLLSNQILYDYYAYALSKVVECDTSDIKHPIYIRHLKRYIQKSKPLKPIQDEMHTDNYVCPKCHKELLITHQAFCHHCGQKMHIFQ